METEIETGATFEPRNLSDLPDPIAIADDAIANVGHPDLAPVHKVGVRVKAVLGHTRVNIGRLMKLRAGDVIDLDRRAGDPVDIWVNNRLIARGEIVLTDGLLSVALTEMVKQAR
jgi:flagellar motor switch protein FliN/FliY